MGQYKERRREAAAEEKPSIHLEAEAKTNNEGHVSISIPKKAFEKLGPPNNPPIYKITLEGKDDKHTYCIEYKDREAVISFAELKPGKYKIKIEPYTIQDFINDFNQTAKQKYGTTLEIQNNNFNIL